VQPMEVSVLSFREALVQNVIVGGKRIGAIAKVVSLDWNGLGCSFLF